MIIKPKLNKNLAILVTMHFLTVLFLAVGFSATLAYIVTAKWYMVIGALLILAGGWYALYCFEEGWIARKQTQS